MEPASSPASTPRYRGRTTVTLWPSRDSASGSAPATSARPPVFANGAASGATVRMLSGSCFASLVAADVRPSAPGVRLGLASGVVLVELFRGAGIPSIYTGKGG